MLQTPGCDVGGEGSSGVEYYLNCALSTPSGQLICIMQWECHCQNDTCFCSVDIEDSFKFVQCYENIIKTTLTTGTACISATEYH
ncbi:unnamed protein product [Clavelina lepadiformis]|uniref:Uncharacterized protein n=1 Tax=Clavelina lepadiformis TaxID=159417 RepID=A0ABP0FHG7_CLALP